MSGQPGVAPRSGTTSPATASSKATVPASGSARAASQPTGSATRPQGSTVDRTPAGSASVSSPTASRAASNSSPSTRLRRWSTNTCPATAGTRVVSSRTTASASACGSSGTATTARPGSRVSRRSVGPPVSPDAACATRATPPTSGSRAPTVRSIDAPVRVAVTAPDSASGPSLRPRVADTVPLARSAVTVAAPAAQPDGGGREVRWDDASDQSSGRRRRPGPAQRRPARARSSRGRGRGGRGRSGRGRRRAAARGR